MRRQLVLAALSLSTILLAATAKAQDARPNIAASASQPLPQPRQVAGEKNAGSDLAQPNIDPALRADILHLLEVTHSVERTQLGVRVAFQSMRPHLLNAVPATPNRDKIVPESIVQT